MSVAFTAKLVLQDLSALEKAASWMGGACMRQDRDHLPIRIELPLDRVTGRGRTVLHYDPNSHELTFDVDYEALAQRFMDRALAEEVLQKAQELYPTAYCQILECGEGFEVDIQLPEEQTQEYQYA